MRTLNPLPTRNPYPDSSAWRWTCSDWPDYPPTSADLTPPRPGLPSHLTVDAAVLANALSASLPAPSPRFAADYAFMKDTARFYFDNRDLLFDGEKYSIRIPEALRPYMGGKALIEQ